MEMVDLNYVVTMCRLKNKKIEEVVRFKTYIPVAEKLVAIDEYIKSLNCYTHGKKHIDSFEQYFKFTMLAVMLYTNITINGTYEEYDTLVKNQLLDEIFTHIQKDYSDLHSIMQMKLNDYLRILE